MRPASPVTEILVIPAGLLPDPPEAGSWCWRGWDWPGQWQWLERGRAETDERFLQMIPYALISNRQRALWCYRRSGGDARLRERFSCGLGGHIERRDERGDLAPTVARALRRELLEELGWALPEDEALNPVGWIFERGTAIGRVHLGLVFHLPWPGSDQPRPAPHEPLAGLGFRSPEEIAADPRFELWSRLALACLPGVHHE